ncbi:MAG: aminotransferase class V-fold PLP-dependent enzyme [Opitutales bacterium]|nr:aminotransferase class V-fold PLP-dependent enzyme [Opitutales bacterium]
MQRKQFLKYLAAGGSGLAMGPLFGSTVSTSHASAPRPVDDVDFSDWASIRKLFPISNDRIYLNTGGLGPPSQPVLDAVWEQTMEQARTGETHHNLLHEHREVAAEYLGADLDEIAFTRNASESNSIVGAGLQLEAGDEVIFESHAHPGGSFPWLNRQKLHGVKVRIFEPDPESPEGNLERLFALVNRRTKAIQVSHVTAPTGILFDVDAIAREASRQGIWFHVDAAQSVGMLPVDVHAIGCDSMGISGHKWMNGPQESGLLYIRKDRLDDVSAHHVGAHSNDAYELPHTFSYRDSAIRHEYGTRNAATSAGIRAAIELQNRIGRERILKHGRSLVKQTREGLKQHSNVEILTPEREDMHGSMISFRVKDQRGREIASRLNTEHNLRCRPVDEMELNAVRISWHVYHQKADVQRLLEGIKAVLS